MSYEEGLIALVDSFWHDNVLAKASPPYTENGDLIPESLRCQLGSAGKDVLPVTITPPQFARVERFLALRGQKRKPVGKSQHGLLIASGCFLRVRM